jgi:multiple sugar transport system ATP-binding protein
VAEILLRGVTKRFGEVTVVDRLDLAVRNGEFLVLVGPSGCGKTSVLRMIAGLEALTEGEVRIGGRVVNALAPKERDVAMVFQNYALYPHMTVRENLEFGLRMRKTPSPEIARLVNEAALILDLGSMLERKPRQLSGGQQQRVALGRALVRKPSAFLFDEPLSNLDARLRVQMRAEIMRLHARLPTTSVYVTHDQVEAMTMGDRIAVMMEGRIHQIGAPLEVYEHPANTFVAQFIGTPSMNLLPVAVSPGGEELSGEAFTLPVPPALASRVSGFEGRGLLVGIRPESLSLSEFGAAASTSAGVAATVEFVETLGHDMIIHTRMGDRALLAKCAARRPPAVGEVVRLAVALSEISLFDAQTGRNLEQAASGRD